MTNKTFAPRRVAVLGSASLMAMVAANAASAVDLNLMLDSNGGREVVMADLIERYKEVAPDVNITMNLVGYEVIRDQLQVQLEAGSGPDIALVTNLGALNPYYVDLTPYVDVAEWEANYGAVLPWYRAGNPGGIYGFHTEMTVTGPYVNLTMFEEAGVDVPAPGATWDDWADATQQVMDELGSYAGMVMDRSGHRMAGPAMSYGAAYFDANGKWIIDDGFRTFSQKMVDWHASGLMPADVWPAVSGGKYANGNEMFFNQDVSFYMSGSWNIGNVQNTVGDNFDWAVVPVPCGPAGCGVMPGGSGMVAFNHTEHPEEAAKFVAWVGETENAREWYSRIFAIPANTVLQAEGLDYTSAGASEAVSEGLNMFAAMAATAAEQTPQAFQAQGNPTNFVVFNATTKYISGVMNGELTMDEAIEKLEEEIEKDAN